MPKRILAEILQAPAAPGRYLKCRAKGGPPSARHRALFIHTNVPRTLAQSPGGLLMPSSDTQRSVPKIWKAYKKSASKDLRNQLIENYPPLFRNHAEPLKAKPPSVVQVDDLTTAGV